MASKKYDDASWHVGGEYPEDLSPDAALIHIGMFLGWAIDKGLESDLLKNNFPELLDQFKKRIITGARVVKLCCDYKLTSDDLNDVGNEFASAYYESDQYMDDYAELSDDTLPTIYHEPDTWNKFTQISAKINEAYLKWSK